MRTVLRLEAVSNGSQLAPVRHCDRLTLDHKIESFKIITTRREDAVTVLSKIFGLALRRSGAEVQRAVHPYAEEWSHVRSSIRTHGGQPIDVGVLQSPPSLGPRATASLLLIGLNCATGSISGIWGLLLHRPSNRHCRHQWHSGSLMRGYPRPPGQRRRPTAP